MQNSSLSETRRGLLWTLLILGLATALIFVPSQFRSEAGATGEGLFSRTTSSDPSLPNYDIRSTKAEGLEEYFVAARQSVGKDAAVVADTREGFVRGEEALRSRLPDVKFVYNDDIRIPEVISPDMWKENVQLLTGPSTAKRSDILRNFVRENNELIGVNDQQADSLKVLADYTNPDGNLSFAHLEQRINDIPVFRGEVKAGFAKDGRMIRVINNLAPGLDYDSLSTDFRNPVDAVKAAARHLNYELKQVDVTANAAESTDLKVKFGTGDWATTAEKMYFPTEPGVARAAWRVLIWQPVNAYYVIVDAETGTMLWRKNVTEDQTQSATYNVYTNPSAAVNSADNPAPLTPGPTDPTTGTQGTIITRNNVTLIGNEAPNATNNLGWITDGANITDGNALEAGIDRDGVNGVDAPQTGNPNRVFTTSGPAWNPPPGSPSPGDEPLTPQAQRGAVIQMFYVMNLYHDYLYNLGFTEPAFNFQNDNFGRGGVAADRISAEGQDSSGTNNANFATVADGGRGRMQMYLWTGPTPDYDGTTDSEVIIHEVTHGTSNRLHGNAAGLSTNMARGMGEGWSDFYGHVMLSQASDPINGIYTTGGYATFSLGGFNANYYYGIRRWPKAVIAFTGGPNRPACNNGPCPHNPFTFKHINAGCDTTLGTTTNAIISAFPRSPVIATAGSCDQVHNAGEVWSSALWEVRALMVTRLGWAVGNRRVLQFVTDGMKLAPLGPTFLTERDAIIAAAVASGTGADVSDIREGFRRRGMGFSASIQAVSPAAVTEAFDFPNVVMTNPFSVSDSTGDNDGFPEPGENVLLSVAITNTTGATVNNVTANVTGGGSANYGNIANGATVTRQLTYTVPAGATCGSLHQVTINVSSDVGPQSPQVREFRLGAPVGGAPVTFVNNTPITIPSSGPGSVYPSNIAVSGVTGSKVIKVELTGFVQGFPDDVDFLLVGPGGQKFIIMSDVGGSTPVNGNVVLVDSAAANLPVGNGNIVGEFKPTNEGANDAFVAPAPTGPYTNPAPGGTDTFTSVFGTTGSAMNGTWSLYVVDDLAGFAGSLAGWKITFESNDYVCNLTLASARADFDGDGRTDLSVFRPSEGNWYLNRSTLGFAVINWGLSTDTLVPGDYDLDGMADTAVFRPSNSAGVPDFYILNSNGFTVTGAEWGVVNDKPVVADYDGDGKADLAVFRPSNNTWYVLNSSNGSNYVEPFGVAGDIPMAMDTNGDARAQITVYRPSNNTWYIARPTGTPATNFDAFPFGSTGDKQVPADYDGDGKDDVAVYRPSNGTWYIRRSNDGGLTTTPFGNATDAPVPGDYDGDGKDDVAIYRNGTWYIQRSASGLLIQAFGLAADTAIPAKYIP